MDESTVKKKSEDVKKKKYSTPFVHALLLGHQKPKNQILMLNISILHTLFHIVTLFSQVPWDYLNGSEAHDYSKSTVVKK